ncbi:recombinase family protein [Streptomyces sp. NPDC059340]|uniref:recombinase family protein n=1 Tax=Streptomyces sp. NPDC059340 TaxID=3346806 RepID=UPI0036C9BDE5
MPYAPEYLHLVIPGVTFEAMLYGRNSDDAIGEGSSVLDQLATGRRLCDSHKWHVTREFSDTDISASRHGRKVRDDFEALIDTIATEPVPANTRRIVVAFQASRYYRDLEAYVRLRKVLRATDTLLCYNGQVYDLSRRDDLKATAMHAVDAEDEAEGIRDGNVRTANSQAQAGLPHGKLLYGYLRTYQTVTGRRRCTGQTEDPVRGRFVLESLQRIDTGHSLRALTRWLNSVPEAARADGKPWTEAFARSMLLNRAYLGERIHKGAYIKAVWAPIKGLESPEGRAMFNRVTATLTSPSRLMQRGSEVAHLLSYLALCGECGDHAVLRYLAPNAKRKPGLCCDEKNDTSIVEARLDAYVEEALIDWFSDKAKARASLIPADDKVKEMAASAQKLINAYEEQLREARAQAEEYDEEAGRFKLSAASLAGMEARLEPKLEAAREKLRSYTGVSPLVLRMLEADDPDVVWNGRPVTEGQPAVRALTLDQKRDVIRKIVTVRLYKAQASGRRPLDDGRIRLSFFGEPGFRAQRLRAPATERAARIGSVPASGTE